MVQILEKHKITAQDPEKPQNNQSESKGDGKIIEEKPGEDGKVVAKAQTNIQDAYYKENGAQKYQKKILYPDTYTALYKSVSVCKTCFLIYSLLSDYFDELIRATATTNHLKKQNSE